MTVVTGHIVNRPIDATESGSGSRLPARRSAEVVPTRMSRPPALLERLPVAIPRADGGGARFSFSAGTLPPGSVAVVAIPPSREVESFARRTGSSPVVVMPMPMHVHTLERLEENRRIDDDERMRKNERLADRADDVIEAQRDMLNTEMAMEQMRAEAAIVRAQADLMKEGFRNLADAAKAH